MRAIFIDVLHFQKYLKKKIIFHSSDINNLSLSNDYKIIKIKKNILSTILKSIENYKIKIIIIDDYKLSYKIETILKKKLIY